MLRQKLRAWNYFAALVEALQELETAMDQSLLPKSHHPVGGKAGGQGD